MVHICVICGEWKVRGTWNFMVDPHKGGKLLLVEDSIKHEELVRMIVDDYNMVDEADKLQLSYALPASILCHMPKDTPPIFVTNDRQVVSFIELCKSHVLRLCVSFEEVQVVGDDDEVDLNKGNNNGEGGCDEVDGGDEDDVSDDDNGDDDDGDDESSDDDVNEAVYSEDEELSGFGRVNDDEDDEEDECEEEDGDVKMGDFDEQKFTLYCMENIHVNQSYRSKDDLAFEVRKLSVTNHFAFKIERSTRRLFVAVCRVHGCKWRLRATTKGANSETFWVKQFEKVHTCSSADRFSIAKRCGPRYIARMFMDKFGVIDGITANHIKLSMRKSYGIKMTYNTAYRALMHAQTLVRGTYEDGYAKLPAYLHLIQQANPGTVTSLEVDQHDRFKYLFIAFGASISGFEFMRRVVVVDGSHLTGKYGGVLLVATAQDGNFQIYPLAFAIVDSENDDSWEWFFGKLRTCISDENAPLVIVSDRNSSIAKACTTVFPRAHRGICYYHLRNNIITKFKGKDIMHLVKGAAYAYTEYDFNRYMDEIWRENPLLGEYLVKADFRLWSRVHFSGDRYNIKTSNIAESINSLLKKARGFPIYTLVEFIRERLGS